MVESSLSFGLESLIKLLRSDPGVDPGLAVNTHGPVSAGPPLLQSNDREKAEDDPNPGPGPDPEVTSRELRWLRLLGHVEMRGRVLRAGAGAAEGKDAAEDAATSVFKAYVSFLGLSTAAWAESEPGLRLRLRLRCRLMLRSSPVAEGRLPRLMEFLVAFLPAVLRLTLAEFPSSDLQGVMLNVLRPSKAERDWVEP